MKKMKIKLIEIKNMLSWMKNTLDGIGSRLETLGGEGGGGEQ